MDGAVLKVKLLRQGAQVPVRVTEGATGLDLFACIEAPGFIELGPDVTRVPTGIALEVPLGYDVQVRPRSGLGSRGVNVVFGSVDADYRGELFVNMYTFGSLQTYRIEHGDRIAQLVVARFESLSVVAVEELTDSQRAAGGFGSTGR
ncbi:MAG TPA: dUTP diphosphatase [Dehalococcoidia bacterium]|nr:dUTP diphosphatase [Dehalococcoidia bacterium]